MLALAGFLTFGHWLQRLLRRLWGAKEFLHPFLESRPSLRAFVIFMFHLDTTFRERGSSLIERKSADTALPRIKICGIEKATI
jgi:hypothetical protein